MTAAPRAGPAGRHQGAHRDRPGSPGARRGPSRGHPARAVAAGRRRRGGRADAGRGRRDARQEHDGRLAGPRAGRGRRRPVGVRRGAAAVVDDRRTAGHRPLGERGRRSSSRRTSTPATSTPYRPDVAILTERRMGPSRRVRRRGPRSIAAFEAWLRRAPAGATLVANVGRRRVSRRSSTRLADWPGTVVAYALVDQAPQRLGGYARAIAERFATATGPRPPLLGRVTGADPDATTLEIHGLDPLAGADDRRGSARPAATTPPTPWRSPARRAALGRRAGGDRRRAWRRSRASAAASSARARRPASSSTTTTAITRRPSARRSRPSASASRAGASGPSTSR